MTAESETVPQMPAPGGRNAPARPHGGADWTDEFRSDPRSLLVDAQDTGYPIGQAASLQKISVENRAAGPS
jgi:hypothetical protein